MVCSNIMSLGHCHIHADLSRDDDLDFFFELIQRREEDIRDPFQDVSHHTVWLHRALELLRKMLAEWVDVATPQGPDAIPEIHVSTQLEFARDALATLLCHEHARVVRPSVDACHVILLQPRQGIVVYVVVCLCLLLFMCVRIVAHVWYVGVVVAVACFVFG